LIREMVARALMGKGFLLWRLNRMEEALAVHDDLVQRFGDATEPAIGNLLKTARLRRAIAIAHVRGAEEGSQRTTMFWTASQRIRTRLLESLSPWSFTTREFYFAI